MSMDGLLSSKNSEWSTPWPFFNLLDAEFRFTLDVCASAENHKCRRFFSVADDGLSHSWGREICWMNPPYGREIGKWVEKAYWEYTRGATVVCLLPARTDTKWWQICWRAVEIRFVIGRLQFDVPVKPRPAATAVELIANANSAPFPSAVVIFSHEYPSMYGGAVNGWDWKGNKR